MHNDGRITLEQLEQAIEKQKVLAAREYELNYDKDYSSNSQQKELTRLERTREILLAGATEVHQGIGCVYIHHRNTTFCFYLLNQIWAAQKNPYRKDVNWVGRKTYRCKSPTDFVKKYVLGDNQ